MREERTLPAGVYVLENVQQKHTGETTADFVSPKVRLEQVIVQTKFGYTPVRRSMTPVSFVVGDIVVEIRTKKEFKIAAAILTKGNCEHFYSFESNDVGLRWHHELTKKEEGA